MSPFTAIVWKEFRQRVSLALAMLAFSVLLHALLECSAAFLYGGMSLPPFFLTALFVTALYAGSAAAISFAGEYDERTFGFLRSLPVSGRTVMLGKLAWLGLSTLAVTACVTLIAVVWQQIAGDGFGNQGAGYALAVCGVAILEASAWGLYWSCHCRTQINAMLLTYLCASASGFLAASVCMGGSNELFDAYVRAVPLRLVIVAALGTVAVRSAAGWLERLDKANRRNPIGAQPKSFTATLRSVLDGTLHTVLPPIVFTRFTPKHVPLAEATPRGAFHALVRLCWAQSRALLTVALLLGPFLLGWCLFNVPFFSADPRVAGGYSDVPAPDVLLRPFAIPILFSTPFFLVLLCGSIFYQDQRNGMYRQLAQRGLAPGMFWWSRILTFGAVLFAGPLLLLLWNGAFWAFCRCILPSVPSDAVYGTIFSGAVLETYRIPFETVLFSFPYLLLAFGAGAFCSLVFRNGIIGLIATGMLSVFLLFGFAVLRTFFGVSPLWTVLPVACALLCASRLRAEDWFRERHTLRSWRTSLAVLTVVPLAVLVAIPFVRVYSVPVVDLGYTVDPALLSKPLDTRNGHAESEDFGSLTHALWDHSGDRGYDRKAPPEEIARDLKTFVIPGLEKRSAERLPVQELLTRIYVYEYRLISQGKLFDWNKNTGAAAAKRYTAWMPWERARALRRLDFQYRYYMEQTSERHRKATKFLENMHRDGVVDLRELRGRFEWFCRALGMSPEEIRRYERDTTKMYGYLEHVGGIPQNGVLDRLFGDYHLLTPPRWIPDIAHQYYGMEVRRRTYLVYESLHLWYLEHGSLPETLDELVGPVLKKLPTGDIDGRPMPKITYFPHPSGEDLVMTRTNGKTSKHYKRSEVPYFELEDHRWYPVVHNLDFVLPPDTEEE